MPTKRACPNCLQADFAIIPCHARQGVPLHPAICKSCGLVLLDPIYNDAEKETLSRSTRSLHRARLGNAPVRKAYRRMIPRSQRCMDFLRKYIHPGDDVLEVGSGDGSLLRLLQQHGASPVGNDLDSAGAQYVQNEFGIPVAIGPFEEVDFGDKQFDAVVSVHFIEHVFDPVAVLAKMKRLLRPGGVLFLETPNILRPKVGPTRVFSLPHNYYFSPRTLTLSLYKAGLQTCAIREFNRDSFQIMAVRPHGTTSREAPTGDPWREVVERIHWHGFRYWASLQFLWRKMPGLNEAVLYKIHHDREGDSLNHWLHKVA